MSRSHYVADLTWPELDELRRADGPVVLLWPLGATEPHGPHAPLATDSIISASACERAARQLADDPDIGAALILPALPFGVTEYGAAFPGAVGVEPATLQRVIVEACRSLARQGLHRIVLVNNHFEPDHVVTLRRAVDELQGADDAAVVLLDLLKRRNVELLTAEFQAGEAHAGRYETSMVLAAEPHLVDTDRMRRLPRVAVDIAQAIADGQHSFVDMGMDQAYCGAPAEATAEEGDQTLTTVADLVVRLARSLVVESTDTHAP